MNNKPIFILLIALTCSVLAMACSNSKRQEKQKEVAFSKEIQLTSNTDEIVQDTIPISTAELGDFPFFGFPDGLKSMNRPIQRKYDMLYFPINGVMTPIEGKVWKTNVSAIDGYDAWSLAYFQKSYDDMILSLDGKKIFDGEISTEEYERYHDDATYLGEDGSIGYLGQKIRIYVIRRENGDDVYIQLTGDTAGGELNILQKEAFKQTITLIKADQIEKDLTEKGKSILHINFDTDKATLKPEGIETIKEIATVLKNNESLNLAIHGYTDNVGKEDHNQTLSENRAKAVVTELTVLGIDATRLSAKGFGSQSPMADNATPEGRTQNRRVELVKQ